MSASDSKLIQQPIESKRMLLQIELRWRDGQMKTAFVSMPADLISDEIAVRNMLERVYMGMSGVTSVEIVTDDKRKTSFDPEQHSLFQWSLFDLD